MNQAPLGNRLSLETSPYLLQHASNPVHWLPWSEEALALAIAQDKPILLSVGYSACHWCHVMAHESFEDPATAALMNEGFINIKVDREERPDLDQIYQFAHQMLTQQPGGWPLTMFLTPDEQMPFFGGTYFPESSRHGMPAFKDILTRVITFYRDHRDDITNQSAAILDVFRQTDPKAPGEVTFSNLPLAAARQALLSEFDTRYGGFGGAPKFPSPSSIDRLLRHWHANSAPPDPDLQSLFMATKTLHSMALGGIYDHVGGGFFRYSVDAHWQIPHFEKMLSDNASLLALYAQAFAATGDRLFWRVANETADWALREMRDPGGGFYATLDADSDGVEGAFYVWERDDFKRALGPRQQFVAGHLGIDNAANFEDRWHLYVADEKALEDDAAMTELAAAKAALYALREQRTRPGRDEKILAGWNGMQARALAIAARHLPRDDLAQAACDALDFVREQMLDGRRLLAVHAGGKARFTGYLDDYANVLDGLLELMQTRFRSADMQFAIALADTLLEHFYDPIDGGFFFTADDHEALVHRMKPLADNATPSGNGIAAMALLRLGHVVGDDRYIDAAATTLRAAWEPINRVPHAHCALLTALEETVSPVQVVVIRAPRTDLARWVATTRTYAPRRMVFAIADDAEDLPGLLAQRVSRDGGVAYVCEGHTCGAPLTSPEALLNALRVDV